MQKITIVAVGNLREKFFKEAYNEYAKRISKFAKLEVIEIKETNRPKEGEEILKHLSKFPRAYLFALEIKGECLTSENFSKLIKDKSHIVFIIGGSEGLEKIKAAYPISFGAITFPHQLMRVVLSEQIFRAFKILNGEKYHK